MYARDLDLYDYAHRLQKRLRNPDKDYPRDHIGVDRVSAQAFDAEFRNADFCLYDVLTNVGTKLKHTPVNVKIRSGVVTEYQTPDGVYTQMSKSMRLSGKKTTKGRSSLLKTKDLTKQTNPNQIHNLNNMSTCHVNALITALSRSDLFRQTISKVANLPTKTVRMGAHSFPLMLCKQIQKIIKEGVEQGKMANDSEGEANYKKHHRDLTSYLSSITVLRKVREKVNNGLFLQNLETTFPEACQQVLLDGYLTQSKQECYTKCSVRPKAYSYPNLIMELFSAISYELDAYGVENILEHTRKILHQYIPTKTQPGLKLLYSIERTNPDIIRSINMMGFDGIFIPIMTDNSGAD